jgi:acyl-CoA thioesterase-1
MPAATESLRVGGMSSAWRLIGVAVLAVAASRSAHGAIKVACVGDSITQGVGTTGGNSYPTALGRLLGAGYQVGNFGDSGSTMMKAPASTSYWITPAFGNSKTFAPDVVVIMLGTNDSKTNVWKGGNNTYRADYRAMIAELAALPSRPRLHLALPPPALTTNFTISGPVIQNDIIPLIRAIAAEAGLPVIDVNAAFNPDPRKYFGAGNGTDIGDGIHPNNAGAMAIARAVAEVLTRPAVDGGIADASPLDGNAPDLAADGRASVGEASAVAADVAADAPGPDTGVAAPADAAAPDARAVGGSEDETPGAGGTGPGKKAQGGRGCSFGRGVSPPWLAALGLLTLLGRRREHHQVASKRYAVARAPARSPNTAQKACRAR